MARQKKTSSSEMPLPLDTHQTTIKRQTAFLGMFFCLIFGLVLGSLGAGVMLDWQRTQGQAQKVSNSTQNLPSKAAVSEAERLIASLEQACLVNPKDRSNWVNLGNAYFDASQPHNAIRAYEQALSLKRNDCDVLTDLGIMYRQTGQNEKAVALFHEAAQLDPSHVQSQLNEGVVLYFDLDRKKEALALWRSLLKTNPSVRFPDGSSLQEFLNLHKD